MTLAFSSNKHRSSSIVICFIIILIIRKFNLFVNNAIAVIWMTSDTVTDNLIIQSSVFECKVFVRRAGSMYVWLVDWLRLYDNHLPDDCLFNVLWIAIINIFFDLIAFRRTSYSSVWELCSSLKVNLHFSLIKVSD